MRRMFYRNFITANMSVCWALMLPLCLAKNVNLYWLVIKRMRFSPRPKAADIINR